MRWGKRGAYFFVLDAFIAGVIIVSSLAVLYTTFSVQESPSQNYVLAEDFITFMEATTIQRYAGDVVYEMWRNGTISDRSLTLLEQSVLFYAEDTPASRGNLSLILEEVTLLAPENNGVGYYFNAPGSDPEFVYGVTPGAAQMEDSRVRLAAQRIVVPRGTTTPYVVEVRIWQ